MRAFLRLGFSVRLLIVAALALPVFAGEYAVLSNGFRIYADRHEIRDGRVTLYIGEGTMEFPAVEVARFEHQEDAPAEAGPVAATPVPEAAPALTPREIVQEAARRYGLPLSLVEGVARAESGFRVDAVSPKGAIGLMQLMPGTAAQLNADPRDPHENADAGVRYLRDLLIKYMDHDYQVELALAAYNAGPGAVDKYKGIPPYRETQDYVRRVIETKRKLER
jgi:soluble lytic murein transglycosylase-like protein